MMMMMMMNLNDIDFESCVEEIDFTYKFTSLLIDNMVKLSQKTSKVRDMGDEVVKTLMEYAENDDGYNKQFLDNLKVYSKCLSGIEDCRDLQVEDFNNKIITRLTKYNQRLKYAKSDVKLAVEMHNKELHKHKRLRNLSIGRQLQFFKNDEDLPITNEKSNKEAQKIKEKIEDYMSRFENEKYSNMLDLLKDFTVIQLKFHNQAVKLLTKSYKCLIKTNTAANNALPIENNLSSIRSNKQNSISSKNVNINSKKNLSYKLNVYESSDEKSSLSSINNNDYLFKPKPASSKLTSILKTTINKSLTNLKIDTYQQDSNSRNSNLINSKPHHSSTPKLNRPQSTLSNNEQLVEEKNFKFNNEARLKSQNNNNNNSKISNLNKNIENNKKVEKLTDFSSSSTSTSSPAKKITIPYQNTRFKNYIDDEDSEDNEMRRELDNYKLILSDDTNNSKTLTDIESISKLDTTDSSEDLDILIKNLEIRSKNDIKNPNSKSDNFTETQL